MFDVDLESGTPPTYWVNNPLVLYYKLALTVPWRGQGIASGVVYR